MSSRRFVLVPLLELDPELALPDGTRLADALAALGDGQRVERSAPLELGRRPAAPAAARSQAAGRIGGASPG